MTWYLIFAIGFFCGSMVTYLASRLGRRSARQDELFRRAIESGKKLRADVRAGQERKARDRERNDFCQMFL